MTPGHLKNATRPEGDDLPQTTVNVSRCDGDCREGDGCIARENQNLKQMVAWITMHNTMDLDSLYCDANQEQRSGAYCSVLSRVTCHVTRDQPRVFVVFN